jgi:hypothetical protein
LRSAKSISPEKEAALDELYSVLARCKRLADYEALSPEDRARVDLDEFIPEDEDIRPDGEK